MEYDYQTPNTNLLDRVERVYLRALRFIVLIVATILVLSAAWLGVSGLLGVSRSVSSVKEASASVTADEIAATTVSGGNKEVAAAAIDTQAKERNFYDDFVSRYYALFTSKLEPYRHADDKHLSKSDFDGFYVRSADRLADLAEGKGDFQQDKADLEQMLSVMAQVLEKPETKSALARYKNARKVQVVREERKMRTSYRSGWDSYSTACRNWFEDPIGCPTTRAVQTPYTERVSAMEYPKGTISHIALLQDRQDRFFRLLNERRSTNAAFAAAQRERIVTGNVAGRTSRGWPLGLPEAS